MGDEEGAQQAVTESQRVNSVDKLAAAIDVDRTTVYRWRNQWGLDDLYDDALGGWDPEDVRAWSTDMKRARRAVMRPGFDVSLESSGEIATEENSRDWGAVYRKAKAILATLQAKRMQETLLDREEVEEQWASRVAELTAALEALPAQLAPILAPMQRETEVQAALDEAFRALRQHFAREE